MSDPIKRLGAAIDGMIQRRMTEQLTRSFCLAMRDERKLRLRTVRALILEIEAIRKVNIFSTGLAETVLEEVIEGDWFMARQSVGHFNFEGEAEDLRARYTPLWQTFRELLAAACDEHDALERGQKGGD